MVALIHSCSAELSMEDPAVPNFDVILNAFITLFVTMDPIGNAPIFLGLTAGMTTLDRRATAFRGVLVSAAILALFAITGMAVLDGMGITIHAFRVAGGLLLFYTAFEMIYAQRQERKEQTSKLAMKDQVANLAVFPLAIPLIAGPGSISATILLASELSAESDGHTWMGIGVLLCILLVLLVITYATLRSAEYFDKYLGITGRLVLTRLLGVLLAALSVQYVADGASALFGGQ
ncbi:MarC family protein [Granulosicoccus sp.]|nr:MarC family protein [Granulosicoccus sp.]MDB4224575.1 MarC family protein [Granulosicoccus sp.]